MRLKDYFKEQKVYFNRVVFCVFFLGILFLALILRLVYLQVFNHDHYTTLSHNNQMRLMPLAPKRGLIYDRNGVVLAQNSPVFSLTITPALTNNVKDTINGLKQILPISEQEEQTFLKKTSFYTKHQAIPIRMNLNQEEVAKFSATQYYFKGVAIAAHLSRYYPHGDLFAHIIGYTGPMNAQEQQLLNKKDYRGTLEIGKTGLEKLYEQYLHGKPGFRQIETDAKGRLIREIETTEPTSGYDLHLALDMPLQQAAKKALGENIGAVVAIDPNTGDILALVSNPSFNPNDMVQGITVKAYQQLAKGQTRPLFNRAIAGQYAPGSIIKPILALQALDQGLIKINTTIHDPGWFQLSPTSRVYHDWNRAGHGWINVEHAIMQSCTTFFYHIGQGLGIHQIEKTLRAYGLGKKTRIDLDAEASGLVPSVAWKKQTQQTAWYDGDTLNVGIGQGALLVTPIQAAQLVASFCMQGKRYQPRLLKAIQPPEHSHPIAYPTTPLPTIPIRNQKNWQHIKQAMQKVVSHPQGLVHHINQGLKYTMGGKTGTAQVYRLDSKNVTPNAKKTKHLRDHSWFIAFAPVEKPTIALAVIVEHNKGSSLVAREVLDHYFR